MSIEYARGTAYAVTRDDLPTVLLATSADVISRVVALKLVAATPAGQIRPPAALESIRTALLEERWADAVVEWMEATERIVDVYDDEQVWSEADLDEDRASLEIRVSLIFRD